VPALSTFRLALPLLLLAGGADAAGDTDLVRRGHDLLERNCAGCHAIGPTGDSAMPEAPPFRDVKKLYPVETLAEPLAEGIVGGHPEMPVRAFAPEDIDAILAYLATL
jgi:cytochrome c